MSQASLILASGSPARAKILTSVGVDYKVEIPRVDEQAIKEAMVHEGYPVRDTVDALAEAKAKKIAQKFSGAHVLAADQVLVFEGKIFNKPTSLEEATSQLVTLKGQTHQLLSAVVMMKDDNVTFRHIEMAKLTMRDFSEIFIKDYVAKEGDSILESVGGYKLEGRGAQLFSRVEGDYFTVLGLPLLPCLEHLRTHGLILK